MSDLLTADRWVGAMLRFEAALAESEAACGLVPTEAAAAIARAGQEWAPPGAEVLAATWEEGSPVIALLAGLRERVSAENREWIHHGATSQDVIDTATVLLTKEALHLLINEAGATARLLTRLADEHRSSPMMGRTFLQHARPTTFGMRAAHWLSPVLAAIERITFVADALPLQFGGPVGHLGLIGEDGPAVAAELARRLELRAPLVSWHTDRAPIIESVEAGAGLARAVGKVAADLTLLAGSDFGLLKMRPGESTAMAGKQNPVDAIHASAAATACLNLTVGIGSGPHQLERGGGAWQAEWYTVPLVFGAAAASVAALLAALRSLEVDTNRMAQEAGDVQPKELAAAEVWVDRVLKRAEETLG